jgi:hypothetical protein
VPNKPTSWRQVSGSTNRAPLHDARKGVRELDVTDAEAEKMGGRQVARRGRRPQSAQT